MVDVLLLASKGRVKDLSVVLEGSDFSGGQTGLADEMGALQVSEELDDSAIESLLVARGTEVAGEMSVSHVSVERL
jgi:hypothetical protein